MVAAQRMTQAAPEERLGLSAAPLSTQVFALIVADCGPQTCLNGGECIDDIPFDGQFACNCSQTSFTGDLCHNFKGEAVVENSSASHGLIVGGGIALSISLVLCACIVLRVYHVRRQRETQLQQQIAAIKAEVTCQLQTQFQVELLEQDKQHFLQLEMARESLKPIHLLGKGAFGEVKLCRLLQHNDAPLFVAVKQLHGEPSASEQRQLLLEARLMVILAHPGVVHVVGLVTTSFPWQIVMEFMSNGDLRTYLHRTRSRLRPENLSGPFKRVAHQAIAEKYDQNWPISPPVGYHDVTLGHLVYVCGRIASAVAFLHEHAIIHRDLAARNVLVGQTLFHVKLSDFGMGKHLSDSDYYRNTSNELVPVKWMALECLQSHKFSTHSDVWSLGVLFWEVFSLGCEPYQGLNATQIIILLAQGTRLGCPAVCPKRLFSYFVSMWMPKPEARPTAAEVVAWLQDEFRLFGVTLDNFFLPAEFYDCAQTTYHLRHSSRKRKQTSRAQPSLTTSESGGHEHYCGRGQHLTWADTKGTSSQRIDDSGQYNGSVDANGDDQCDDRSSCSISGSCIYDASVPTQSSSIYFNSTELLSTPPPQTSVSTAMSDDDCDRSAPSLFSQTASLTSWTQPSTPTAVSPSETGYWNVSDCWSSEQHDPIKDWAGHDKTTVLSREKPHAPSEEQRQLDLSMMIDEDNLEEEKKSSHSMGDGNPLYCNSVRLQQIDESTV
eukprot:m.193382 g.193382  ORF g.193382 m.193382 type:complete len:720 (-) comp16780_c0_seq1:284-2443(-)